MRYRRRSRDEGIAIIVVFVGAMIYTFVRENLQTILTVLYITGGVIAVFLITFFTVKIVRRVKRKKAYEATAYHRETGIRYSPALSEKGVKFEIDSYNKIRAAVGPQYPMLADVLVPQINAVNKDSQIDLILFHSSGVYVIEMKNYAGPLIGGIDDERWIPYVEKRRKGKSGRFEDVYEQNWALYDRQFGVWKPLNPIKQNDIHVATLNKLFPANYINMVILSDAMFMSTSTVKSMIDNVMSLDDFIAKIRRATPDFPHGDLLRLAEQIRSVDRQSDPKAKLLHIARVKAKEQSSSKRR